MALIRSVLFVALFALPVLAQEAGNRRKQSFNRSDKNKDGRISREEFTGRPENFARRDQDKDGFITRKEFGLKPATTEQVQQLTAGDNENTTPQGTTGISSAQLALQQVSGSEQTHFNGSRRYG